MSKITTSLGKTIFELEDSDTPNVLKITRSNSDGPREFFVPRELVLEYALQYASGLFVPALRMALGIKAFR